MVGNLKGLPLWIAEDWLKTQIKAGVFYIDGKDLQTFLVREGQMVTEDMAFDFLFEAMKKLILNGRGMVICNSNEAHVEPEILLDYMFEQKVDGSFGIDFGLQWNKNITCSKCKNVVRVNEDTVFIVFSPTEQYKQWLNKNIKAVGI
jgi:hypothetical protein